MSKVGRNEECPCGSKKKFKKCCGKADQAQSDGGDDAMRSRVEDKTNAMKACMKELEKLWIKEQKTGSNTKVPLDLQIEAFAAKKSEWVLERCPFLEAKECYDLYWSMFFTAVMLSKTHPSDDVLKAQDKIHLRNLGTTEFEGLYLRDK